MNKFLAWLPALVILGATIYQPVKQMNETKPVEKSISIEVYKGSQYASDIYANTSAQVHIIVEKVNNKGERTVIWDTISAKLLKQYPSEGQALQQHIVIPNVNERKEHLEVTYILTYNSKGSELQMQDGMVVSGKSGKLDISI